MRARSVPSFLSIFGLFVRVWNILPYFNVRVCIRWLGPVREQLLVPLCFVLVVASFRFPRCQLKANLICLQKTEVICSFVYLRVSLFLRVHVLPGPWESL